MSFEKPNEFDLALGRGNWDVGRGVFDYTAPDMGRTGLQSNSCVQELIVHCTVLKVTNSYYWEMC